ncbi:MAG: FAD-dependent oxidoreductase, partial [Pseudomonadota bacterium]
MPKVLVIGGGIVGLLTAAALKDGGADVEVFASQTGPRASDGSLVWLNVSSTHDPTYAALRAASMRFWHKSDAPVPWQGALLWPENEPATDLLTSQNCDWEAVDQTRFSELAPGVAAPPDGAIFCPGEGACDPADMLNWAEARLDVPRNQAHVVGVEPGCVTLDTGDVVHPDKIIVAAGCATPGLVAPLGAHIALKSAPGLFLRTQPVAPMATPVLASPDMDFWQGADGRMVIATGTNDVLRQDPQAAADQALSKVR